MGAGVRHLFTALYIAGLVATGILLGLLLESLG